VKYWQEKLNEVERAIKKSNSTESSDHDSSCSGKMVLQLKGKTHTHTKEGQVSDFHSYSVSKEMVN
jgi:hypothetical protein